MHSHTFNFQMLLQAPENILLLIYIPRYVDAHHPLHIHDQNRSNLGLKGLNCSSFETIIGGLVVNKNLGFDE